MLPCGSYTTLHCNLKTRILLYFRECLRRPEAFKDQKIIGMANTSLCYINECLES